MATLQDLLNEDQGPGLRTPSFDVYGQRKGLGSTDVQGLINYFRTNPEAAMSMEELRQAAAERAIQQEMELTRRASLGDQRAAANLAATKQREEIEGRPLKRFTTLAGSLRGLDPDVQQAFARQFGVNVPGGGRLQRVEDEARIKARVATAEKANAPLGVDLASKLYRYNAETKQLEVPEDPDMTGQQAKAQGFRVVSPKILERMSETTAIRPAFGALKVAVDQANQHNIVSLGLGRWSGGLVGSEAGKLLDTATRDFALQFDRLMGGVRGAASVTLFEAMRQRMPEIVSTPNVRTRSLGILEGIMDTLEDNSLRTAFGMPLDKAGLKKAEDNARLVVKMADEAKKAPTQFTPTAQQTTKVRDLKTGKTRLVKGNPTDEELANEGYERVR